MRTAPRSLVVVLALVISVVAAPAYAGDDSPGLLDTLGKTVGSLTAPILSPPKAKPQAAPSVVEQAPAKQAPAPTVVKAVSDTVTTLTTTVGDTLHATPLAPLVDPVLALVTPKAAAPGAAVPEVAVPEVATLEQDLGDLISSLGLLGAPSTAGLDIYRFSASASSVVLPTSLEAESGDAVPSDIAEAAHIPGTSTLPDGGSSLTITWLLLWAGVTAAGALLLRRSRTTA